MKTTETNAKTAKPATIAAYIRAAPKVAQPHLRRLHAILAEVAPDAEQTIKWNAPFFVEPRFLYSYAAFKAHLAFVPSQAILARFRDDLRGFRTTKNYLQLRYDEPLPEALIRRIAIAQRDAVAARTDDAFW